MKYLNLIILISGCAVQLSLAQSYQWTNRVGSTTGDWGRGVAIDTASGSVYATGYFTGSIDVDPGPGTVMLNSVGLADAYIIKYDASGNYLWAFNIGSADSDYGNGIVCDQTSGSIYIIGAFGDSADFDPGIGTDFRHAIDNKAWFLAKYDSSGNYLWAIDGEGAYSDAHCLSYNPVYDHIAVGGEFFDSLDFDPGPDTALLSVNGNTDNFIVNYDGSGNYQWGINIGNSNYDFIRDISTEHVLNSVYVTGSYYDTLDFDPSVGVSELIAQGGQDAYIAKYDSAGNYLWAFSFGAATHDAGSALTYNQTFGALTVTGVFNGSIDFDPDTGIANLNSQGYSMYVANYSSSGGYQWAFKVGGTTVNGYGITTDEQYGSIYLTGDHYGMADFDPGPGSGVLTVPGWSNMYVAKYDAFGNYKWAFGIGLSEDQRGIDITTNPTTKSVYVTGWFESTADFDPGTNTTILTSLGSQDAFVAKFTDCDGNPITNVGTQIICEGDSALIFGTYQTVSGVYYDSSGTGCDSVFQQILNVNLLPVVSILGLDAVYCKSDANVSLTGNPPDGVFSGNGVSNNEFLPSSAGLGTSLISYLYTDSLGCSITTSQSVSVNICTGIVNLFNAYRLEIFPNPTTSIIHINFTGKLTQPALASIANIQGEVIATQRMDVTPIKMDISQYARGVYIIKINAGMETHYRRIVKI
ncbi:MAG: T9SS type A sorting domain-containing protein [Flavobacteriales bacterium]|nr:T9SS type A sorting domain-containing protein [Flavobacteriales bacterium]